MNFKIDAPKWMNVNIHHREEGRIEYFDIIINTEEKMDFPNVKIEWYLDIKDMHTFWHCGAGKNKNFRVDWQDGIISNGTNKAPVYSFMNVEGKNRYTLAYSNCIETSNFALGVHEETGELKCVLSLFEETCMKRNEYKETIRMDFRDIPYYDSLKDVTNWYETMGRYMPTEIPNEAKTPVYSTWYSFHQNINDRDIESQCKLAKELGMNTIIVDDGWQTDDNNRGYAYTGDWNISNKRFPDMRRHVDAIHEIGMKYMIWYSVPYIGIKSNMWSEFKNKILYYDENMKAGILDLRYLDIQEYLLNKYIDMVNVNDIDGLKLDFVDEFDMKKAQNSAQMYDSNRAFESIQEAVDYFLKMVITELKKMKKNIMIEFRQRYIGPAMRQYGNMFRVGDCPYDILTNRVNSIDLRLLSGNTPVHSDMLMWNKGDTVESAALQFINVLFAVPQYSMKLDEISKEHMKMTKFYLDFMKNNSDVLLDGKLIPYNPELLYPKVESYTNNKRVIVFYGDTIINLHKNLNGRLFIINGALKEEIVLDIENNINASTQIFDCMGNVLRNESIEWNKGLQKVYIPKSGMIVIDLA